MSTAAAGVVYIGDTGHAIIIADVVHVEATISTLISSIRRRGDIVVSVILSVSRVQ